MVHRSGDLTPARARQADPGVRGAGPAKLRVSPSHHGSLARSFLRLPFRSRVTSVLHPGTVDNLAVADTHRNEPGGQLEVDMVRLRPKTGASHAQGLGGQSTGHTWDQWGWRTSSD